MTRTHRILIAFAIVAIAIVVMWRDRDAREPQRVSTPSSQATSKTPVPTLPQETSSETLSRSNGVSQQPPGRTLDTQLPALKPREGAPPTQPHGKQLIVETAPLE